MAAAQLGGTIQNDILKEYIARGTYIFPPRPSMRLITDTFAYCAARTAEVEHDLDQRLPHPRGRLHRRAGDRLHAGRMASPMSRRRCAAGLAIDEFAPRLSFFFNGAQQLSSKRSPSSAPRGACGRRSCASASARADPRSLMLRFHTQTAGVDR